MPRPDGTLYHFEREQTAKPARQRVKVVQLKPKVVTVRPVYEKPDLRVKLQPTPEVIQSVCDRISVGLGIESALVCQGLSRAGADKWLKQHTHARLAFEEAEAKWELDMVTKLHGFASKEAKAAQWLLERRQAARWAAVTKAEITGKGGGAIQHQTLSHVLLASVGGKQDLDPADRAKPVNHAGDC